MRRLLDRRSPLPQRLDTMTDAPVDLTGAVNQAWFQYQLERMGQPLETHQDAFVAGYLKGASQAEPRADLFCDPSWTPDEARALLASDDLRKKAAAVPAGNQAKAPTALDEMRALQEGAQRNGPLRQAAQQLRESREVLARVEAERDEWQRVAEELGDVIRCSSPLAWAATGDMEGAGGWEKMALSALDQAASEAEVTERAIVVGSVWEHAYHRMRATVVQLTDHDNSVHIQWEDGERRVWPDWQLRAHFTWVRDPEATEIVGAPTERCKCGCRRDTHNAPRHHHLQADASLPLCGCIGFEPVTESAPREG
jgi:hypothetical protein